MNATTWYWLTVIGSIVSGLYLLFLIYRTLGLKDTIYTFLKGGTGKAFVNGEGEPQGFIISYPDHAINDPSKPWFNKTQREWEILPIKGRVNEIGTPWFVPNPNNDPTLPKEGDVLPNTGLPNYPGRTWFQKVFGMYFIPYWPVWQVYHYLFSWVEFRQPKGKIEYEVNSREELTEIFVVKYFPYFSTVSDIFIKGNLLFSVDYGVNISITNPMIALFKAEEWLTSVLLMLNERAKNWVGTQELEELVSDTDKVQGEMKETFSEWMSDLNGTLMQNFGCMLQPKNGANFLKLVPRNDEAKEALNAMKTVFIEARNAKAAVHRAENIKLIGTAEADVVEKKARAAVAGEQIFVDAYKDNPDLARSRAIEQTNLGSFVEGGARSGVIVNTPTPEKKTIVENPPISEPPVETEPPKS